MVEAMSLERRAAIHSALAEPIRLAIVDALLLGDASPGELGDQLDLPSNLLAHHLRVLREAGLVERTRSEGDRRRSYLRLIPAALTALNLAVTGPVHTASRILFVCTHNSARSQLAAALWNQREGQHWHCGLSASSAGTDPREQVHPRAIATARRHGLALQDHGTAHVQEMLQPGDLVIAVCDAAYENLGRRPVLHWSVPDPIHTDTDAAFEDAFTEIATRIERLVPAVSRVRATGDATSTADPSQGPQTTPRPVVPEGRAQ